MSTSLGIIQGRLSPYTGGKIQSFPKNTWENEFILAKQLGLNTIELCLDSDDWEKNPIWTVQGTNRIKELTQETGIKPISLDPLYLAERGLRTNTKEITEERNKIMENVIPNCKELDMDYILMPVMIGPGIELSAELRSKNNRPNVLKFLKKTIEIARDYEIKLALETSLNAKETLNLMETLNSDYVVVCYDTGNSAFFGHDILSDIQKLSQFLVEVHIKDHKNTNKNGEKITSYNSVKLGTGDVDFHSVFNILNKNNFSGSYILQMARDNDHIGVAKYSIDFVKKFIH